MRKLSLFLVSFKIPPAISFWLFVNSSFSKNSNVSEMFFEQTSPMLIEPTLTFNEESLSLFPLQPSQTLVLIKLSIHLLIPNDWVCLYLL